MGQRANSLKVPFLIHEKRSLSEIFAHFRVMAFSFLSILLQKGGGWNSSKVKRYLVPACFKVYMISKVSDLLVPPCCFFVPTTKRIRVWLNISQLWGPLLSIQIETKVYNKFLINNKTQTGLQNYFNRNQMYKYMYSKIVFPRKHVFEYNLLDFIH